MSKRGAIQVFPFPQSFPRCLTLWPHLRHEIELPMRPISGFCGSAGRSEALEESLRKSASCENRSRTPLFLSSSVSFSSDIFEDKY